MTTYVIKTLWLISKSQNDWFIIILALCFNKIIVSGASTELRVLSLVISNFSQKIIFYDVVVGLTVLVLLWRNFAIWPFILFWNDLLKLIWTKGCPKFNMVEIKILLKFPNRDPGKWCVDVYLKMTLPSDLGKVQIADRIRAVIVITK